MFHIQDLRTNLHRENMQYLFELNNLYLQGKSREILLAYLERVKAILTDQLGANYSNPTEEQSFNQEAFQDSIQRACNFKMSQIPRVSFATTIQNWREFALNP